MFDRDFSMWLTGIALATLCIIIGPGLLLYALSNGITLHPIALLWCATLAFCGLGTLVLTITND
jgi:hypothetical protein